MILMLRLEPALHKEGGSRGWELKAGIGFEALRDRHDTIQKRANEKLYADKQSRKSRKS